jgi:hypothetical protein
MGISVWRSALQLVTINIKSKYRNKLIADITVYIKASGAKSENQLLTGWSLATGGVGVSANGCEICFSVST